MVLLEHAACSELDNTREVGLIEGPIRDETRLGRTRRLDRGRRWLVSPEMGHGKLHLAVKCQAATPSHQDRRLIVQF